jgi:MYXO-CTERM domain-containing protein
MVDYTLRMLPDGGLARDWNDGRPSDAVALLPDGGLESLGPIDPDAGSGTAPDDGGDLGAGEAGCGCRTAGGSSNSGWVSGLVLLAAAIRRNRRRFRRRSG